MNELANVYGVEPVKVGKYTVRVVYDTVPVNPREEFDTPFTILYDRDSRYYLGDKAVDAEVVQEIVNSNDYIYMSVYAYIHSGTSLSTGMGCPDNDDIFRGMHSGIIYISKEDIRKNWNVKRISKKLLKDIYKYMEMEVKEFSQYLNGEIYMFVVEDEYGHLVETCGNFYDAEIAMTEGKSTAEWVIKDDERQAARKILAIAS